VRAVELEKKKKRGKGWSVEIILIIEGLLILRASLEHHPPPIHEILKHFSQKP
jgi:hypothetical protein